ncbi:hypothetical protein niasHT_018115 [Heterodera trifolii]|uniref:Secreted protein n=1 Tax=Heterodera trifolii TaxID=157864 RepID=A0ABD2L5G9_9BILA
MMTQQRLFGNQLLFLCIFLIGFVFFLFSAAVANGAHLVDSNVDQIGRVQRNHNGDINIRRGIERFNDNRMAQNELDFLHI